MTVEPVGGGAYRIAGRPARLAYAVESAEGWWVFLDGRVWVVDPDNATGPAPPGGTARKRRRTHDLGALAAPMPATVLRLAVGAGDRVSTGDVLVVLEAMKMELAVKAPRDGVVKSVACRPGELVQPGSPLLELE